MILDDEYIWVYYMCIATGAGDWLGLLKLQYRKVNIRSV